MRIDILRVSDLLFFVLFPVAALATAICASVTGAEAVGQVVAWISAAAWVGISSGYLRSRYTSTSALKFKGAAGIWVAWSEAQYAVSTEEFNAEIGALIKAIVVDFPGAEASLNDCIVLFREPTWIQWSSGRKIAGEQDNTLVSVGWHQDLKQSALKHELFHRVLQVCAGDPEENSAHKIMREYGF